MKTPKSVENWFKKHKPIILIKDKKTGKTIDMLDLFAMEDRVYVMHNGAFEYKSTNGKERAEYFKTLKKGS
jgi:hypothetical protein